MWDVLKAKGYQSKGLRLEASTEAYIKSGGVLHVFLK